MEKNKHSIEKRITPVKIYLEDLEELINIVKELNFNKITIETEEYTLDVAELSKIKSSRCDYIKIVAQEPYTTIEFISGINKNFFDEGYVRVYISENTIGAVGLIEKIVHILNKKRKKLNRFFVFVQRYTLPMILIASILYLIYYHNSPFDDFKIFFYYSILILLYPLPNLYFMRRNTIILDCKKEAPSFWVRNRDSMVVGITSAVIGAIVGAIAGVVGTLLLMNR